jgi:hypothetical protein
MSELTQVVDRIRQSRCKPANPTMTPAEARAAFASFPPAIRAAMKAAAPVEGWSPAQWVDETALVADLLQQPDHTPAVETALLGLYADIAGARR